MFSSNLSDISSEELAMGAYSGYKDNKKAASFGKRLFLWKLFLGVNRT